MHQSIVEQHWIASTNYSTAHACTHRSSLQRLADYAVGQRFAHPAVFHASHQALNGLRVFQLLHDVALVLFCQQDVVFFEAFAGHLPLGAEARRPPGPPQWPGTLQHNEYKE